MKPKQLERAPTGPVQRWAVLVSSQAATALSADQRPASIRAGQGKFANRSTPACQREDGQFLIVRVGARIPEMSDRSRTGG